MGLDVFLFKQRESTSCYTANIHILLNDNMILLSLLFGNKALLWTEPFLPALYIFSGFFNITRIGISDIVTDFPFPMQTRNTCLKFSSEKWLNG